MNPILSLELIIVRYIYINAVPFRRIDINPYNKIDFFFFDFTTLDFAGFLDFFADFFSVFLSSERKIFKKLTLI